MSVETRAEKRAGKRSGRGAHRELRVADDFYGSALDAAERRALSEAAQVEGLDEEIALLRMKLREAISPRSSGGPEEPVEPRPETLPLMMKGIELLVKAVSARYRLSPEAKKDLATSISSVLAGASAQFYREE